MNRNRPDEEYARKAFDAYLRNRIGQHPAWSPGDEPPDYYLTLDHIRYVVEVTSLMGQIERGNRKIPLKSVHEAARDMVDDVKKEVVAKNVLSGTYYISFSGVYRDFYPFRKNLTMKLVECIESTSFDAEVNRIPIEIEGMEYCFLTKTRKPDNAVHVGLFPGDAKWEVEACQEANALVAKAVKDKAYRMRNLAEPKVLLLLNLFDFAEPRDYQRWMTSRDIFEDFHTIFLIGSHTDSQHCMLHTLCKEWA